MNFNSKYNSKNKGFTLLEMLVAIFIFTIVVTVAASAIINIINVNRKSRELQTVMGNINLAIESLSRDIRFGSNYSCNNSTALYPDVATDCSGNGVEQISLARNGQRIVYNLFRDPLAGGKGKLVKTVYDPGPPVSTISNDMTSTEVDITKLAFYVVGVGGSNPHPRVLITLSGLVKFTTGEPTTFSIQTTVAQRNL